MYVAVQFIIISNWRAVISIAYFVVRGASCVPGSDWGGGAQRRGSGILLALPSMYVLASLKTGGVPMAA